MPPLLSAPNQAIRRTAGSIDERPIRKSKTVYLKSRSLCRIDICARPSARELSFGVAASAMTLVVSVGLPLIMAAAAARDIEQRIVIMTVPAVGLGALGDIPRCSGIAR